MRPSSGCEARRTTGAAASTSKGRLEWTWRCSRTAVGDAPAPGGVLVEVGLGEMVAQRVGGEGDDQQRERGERNDHAGRGRRPRGIEAWKRRARGRRARGRSRSGRGAAGLASGSRRLALAAQPEAYASTTLENAR